MQAKTIIPTIHGHRISMCLIIWTLLDYVYVKKIWFRSQGKKWHTMWQIFKKSEGLKWRIRVSVFTLGCKLGPLGPKVGAAAKFTRVHWGDFPGALVQGATSKYTPELSAGYWNVFYFTVTSASAPRHRCKKKQRVLLRSLVMKIPEPRLCYSEDSVE